MVCSQILIILSNLNFFLYNFHTKKDIMNKNKDYRPIGTTIIGMHLESTSKVMFKIKRDNYTEF